MLSFDHGVSAKNVREQENLLAANTKAAVIIQHDARDIDKLPAFPGAAKSRSGKLRGRPATS